MADTKMGSLPSANALGDTDSVAVVQTTTKEATMVQVATYVVDTITDAATQSPATTHQLMGALANDTPKMFDLDAVSDYVGDYLASGVSIVTPVAGDHVMLHDLTTSGMEKVLVSVLNTKMLDGTTDASATLKASIRNISGVTDLGASVDGTEHMLVCDGNDPKRATLAQIETYIRGRLATYVSGLGALVSGTIADADDLFVNDATVGKQIAASQFATYVEGKIKSNIAAYVWDTVPGGTTTPVDADVFLLERSGTRYSSTAEELYNYIEAELVAVDVATLVTGDHVLFVDATDGNPKRATAAALATYVTNTGTLAATVVTPILTDHIVLNQGGTAKRALVSAMGTKMFDGTTAVSTNMRADVLTFSGLASEGTPDGDELLVVDDSGTPKEVTCDELATFVHSDATVGLAKYIDSTLSNTDPLLSDHEFFIERSAAGTAVTTTVIYNYIVKTIFDETDTAPLLTGDRILVERSGTPLTADIGDINTFVAAAVQALFDPQWDTVDTDYYTGIPDDTDTLTMTSDGTDLMEVGYPIKYTIGGTDYYGIVRAVTGGTSIDIRGASLSSTVTALYVGPPNRVIVERIKIPGNYLIPWQVPVAGDEYAGPTSDILALVGRQYIAWRHGPAKLVAMAVTQGTEDETAQPKLNVKVDTTAVLTQGGGNGIPVSGTAGTWTWSDFIGIDTAQYSIVMDDAIEIFCTCDDSETGEASDLSIELVFVLE